ncbi:hypothetical protein NTG1052_570004 [Candidatus Nitrotoga sp. 1052]|nr:hypothetical protein NTG1052_570004 [Candidatus Nitrotoga sp. 1052]
MYTVQQVAAAQGLWTNTARKKKLTQTKKQKKKPKTGAASFMLHEEGYLLKLGALLS